LNFLDEKDLRITFFVVGQDASLEENHRSLSQLTERGHEIASHSFNHEPWLHLYTDEQIHSELQKAEEAIAAATGVHVDGFRGPGFSISEGTLRALSSRGYRYDATTFPNILNSLARAYFFRTSNLSHEEKQQRKALFGSCSDAFRPVKPYRWTIHPTSLLEIPVTTKPLLKIPIHFSYHNYLGSNSPHVARSYARFAVAMCRLTRTEPSLLFHPLDFMGREDDEDLAFFPAMSMPVNEKLGLMEEFIGIFLRSFDPVTMGQHVDRILDGAHLKDLKPDFSY
jgi:peptidoglycan/xylan/chitin deacetylase (PgdA/CDA1 family)